MVTVSQRLKLAKKKTWHATCDNFAAHDTKNRFMTFLLQVSGYCFFPSNLEDLVYCLQAEYPFFARKAMGKGGNDSKKSDYVALFKEMKGEGRPYYVNKPIPVI